MKDIGTYYGMMKGGQVVSSYGEPRRDPTDWRITSENRLFDPVKGYSNAATNFDWMKKNLKGDSFAKVEIALDPIDEDLLLKEVEKAEKLSAADKLHEEEIEAIERKKGVDLSNIEVDNSIFGTRTEHAFYGLVVYDFDENHYVKSNGEIESSFRKSGVLKKRRRRSRGSLSVHPSVARSLIHVASEKPERRVAKLMIKVEKVEESEISEDADESRIRSAVEKLSADEREALGLSESENSKCVYDKPWQGACGEPTLPGSDFCEKHEKMSCRVCGDQATGGCPHAGSLVCGAPLCDDHTHSDHSSSMI